MNLHGGRPVNQTLRVLKRPYRFLKERLHRMQPPAAAPAPAPSILDAYCKELPTPQTAINLFGDLDTSTRRGAHPVSFILGPEARRVFDLVGMTDRLLLTDPPLDARSD